MPGRVWNCNMAHCSAGGWPYHQDLRVLHSMGGGASDTGKTCVEIDQQHLHEEGQASHLRTEAGAKLAAGLDFPR